MRKSTKLQPICQKRSKVYRLCYCSSGEEKCRHSTKQLCIIVDGWSQQSEHFIGFFECFQNEGFKEKLFSVFRFADETGLGSDSFSAFIEELGPVRS